MGQFLLGKSKQNFHVDTFADCGLANLFLPTPQGPDMTKEPSCWWSFFALLEIFPFFPQILQIFAITAYPRIGNFEYFTKVHHFACVQATPTH